MRYPQPIQDLIACFRRFPGVGPKSAERFVLHLLRHGAPEMNALDDAIRVLRDRVDRCDLCGTFAEHALCVTCRDPRRDGTILCVVEESADLLAVERTGAFTGRYHVLGGLLAPIEGIGPEQLRIRELVERVRKTTHQAPGTQAIKEVIFAFDPTIEGETTVNYLSQLLASTDVRCTRLARGIPVGGDLEYADPVTLGDALSGRRELLVRSPIAMATTERSRETPF